MTDLYCVDSQLAGSNYYANYMLPLQAPRMQALKTMDSQTKRCATGQIMCKYVVGYSVGAIGDRQF